MSVVKAAPLSSHLDMLDRVLDRGIVIDASIRISLVGIELIGVDARVVVSSISTYVERSDDVERIIRGKRVPAPALGKLPPAPLPARQALASERPSRETPAARETPANDTRPERRLRQLARRQSRATVRCEQGCTLTGRRGKRECPYDANHTCVFSAI